MDLGTLIGLIFGLSIVSVAIAAGADIWTFVNLPGLGIVVGGTFAVTLMKFRLSTVWDSLRLGVRTVFMERIDDPLELIATARSLATVVRKQGILGLEDQKIGNPFMKKGVDLCVDGHPPEFIEEVLIQEIEQSIQRHEVAERMFRGISDAAPGLGMLGTLVGLVQMLNNMQEPASIGPAMAIALLTTFYGAMIAQMIAIPMAEKLQLKSLDEHRNMALVVHSVLNIVRGQNPRVLTELLSAYVAPRLRDAISNAPEAERT